MKTKNLKPAKPLRRARPIQRKAKKQRVSKANRMAFKFKVKPVKPPKYGQNLTELFAYLTKHRQKIGHIALCVEARDGEQMPSRTNPKHGTCGDGFVFIGDGWGRITEVEKAMVARLYNDAQKNPNAPY